VAFVLFLLVNAVLYTRPMEVVPDLQDVPLYNCLILACLACAIPGVLEQFMAGNLRGRPVTVCVLGLQAAAVLSHVSHTDFDKAAHWGYVFFTILVYYLLVVATVDTPARLRTFLFCLTLSILVLTFLALAQYHGLIEFNKIKSIDEKVGDASAGTDYVVKRMVGPGVVFADPNDICGVFVVGVLLSIYWLSDARLGFLRLLWVGPLGVFVYGMAMTYSRGGFVALLVGLMVLLQSRFGWRRSLLMGAAALPALLVLFAGRATDLSAAKEGTGQQRFQIWSDALMTFRTAPAFGVGMGEFGKEGEYAAHNSYVHCFAELGLLGGTLFLGAFYVAFRQVKALCRQPGLVPDAELRRLAPFVLAVLAAYAASLLSLSRQFVPTTYTFLGLATAYVRVAAPGLRAPVLPFDARLAQRLAVVSAGFLVAAYVFVRVITRLV
jgi:hypothetical protein